MTCYKNAFNLKFHYRRPTRTLEIIDMPQQRLPDQLVCIYVYKNAYKSVHIIN